MIEFIIKPLYFMLPAYFANMAPVFAMKYLKKLGVPINSRLLGSHKTWRGVIAAIIFSWIIIYIQKFIGFKSIIDYDSVNIWALGFLLGFGAMFGDCVKSYFKRRIGIEPGKPWYIIDQLDYPLGAMMFASFVVAFSWKELVIILVGSFILTVIGNHVAHYIGIRKTKW